MLNICVELYNKQQVKKKQNKRTPTHFSYSHNKTKTKNNNTVKIAKTHEIDENKNIFHFLNVCGCR